jgi:endonuclease YncB( thermonuclease family)
MLKFMYNCLCWKKETPLEFHILNRSGSEMALLQNVTYKDTIPFVPSIALGKVIKVYDGDTFTLAAQLPYNSTITYRFSIRLNGIDSPEIKSTFAVEKQLAIVSKDALSNLIMDKIVSLKNISIEKYGRILADVYLDELHVNKWMIANGYAIKYTGGTKYRPNEWEA